MGALHVLSTMAPTPGCRSLVAQHGGAAALAHCLERLSLSDPTWPNPYGVAVLDAVRLVVLDYPGLLAAFVQLDGLGHMLHFVETCNPHMRPLCLQLLADFLKCS